MLNDNTQTLLSNREEDLFSHAKINLSVLKQRAYNLRWATQDPDVIPLTAADSDFPVAQGIIDGIRDYIQPGYLSYGPSAGLPEFREVAAQTLNQRQGMVCNKDQIFVVNSAASALYLVARFALNQLGDEAIIADPVDFLFERSVLAAGGKIRRFSLKPEANYAFDPDEVESLIRPGKTKLLCISNPHNPLGRVWTGEELALLADIALKHNLWIMSDEVWADIVYAPHTHTSIAALSPEVTQRTFSIFGFSKSYGLAGLRLGLLVNPNTEIQQAMVYLSQADETAYGVSTLSQMAGLAAYKSAGKWLQRFLVHLLFQRDYAVTRLNQIEGVTCHAPEGTFVLFPDISSFGVDSEALVDRLCHRYGVALVPGSPRFSGPGAQGHIRLSFATSREILSAGLDRLETGLRDL